MVLNDIIGLLYSARNNFQSIHMEWEYVFNEKLLQKLFDSQNDQSFAILRSSDGKNQVSPRTDSLKLLLHDKYHYLRLEKESETHRKYIHAVVKNNLFILSPPNKIKHIQEDNPIEIEDQLSLAAEHLDPSFLLSNHDLSFVGKAVFLGRDAIQLQAFPRPSQRNRGREAYFWHSTNEIDLVVDQETGILLEYKLSFEGVEFARSTVSKIIFDLDILEDDILENLQ